MKSKSVLLTRITKLGLFQECEYNSANSFDKYLGECRKELTQQHSSQLKGGKNPNVDPVMSG